MATETELYKEILAASGGNPDELPDNLRSTLLKAIAKNVGSGGTGGGGFAPVVTYGDTLTWDGNTEGLVAVADMLYKISDNVLTIEDVKDGITVGLSNKTSTSYSYEEISQAYTEYGIIAAGGVYNIPSANFELMGMVFPEAGIYVMNAASATAYTESITIPGYAGFETTTYPKIPVESLPEGYPYTEESSGVVETVILEETTLTSPEEEPGEFYIQEVLPLVGGNTYKVNWNGTEYTCVATEVDYTSQGMGVITGIGNGTDMGLPGNGEPFLIAAIPAQGMTLAVSWEGLTSATVKITGTGIGKIEIIHKMDEKYLPEMPAIYTFKGLFTADDVREWPDNATHLVPAHELFDIVRPFAEGGKTVFFLEIIDNGVTYEYPCLYWLKQLEGAYGNMSFSFNVTTNANKTASINISNIPGD